MHKTVRGVYYGTALVVTGLSTVALADDNNAHIEGIVTGTYQAATKSHFGSQDIHSEGSGQFLVFGSLDMGPGSWNLEARGSTTPHDNGVSSFYGSNATVGETTNSHGDGRIAATQLFYELAAGPGQFRAGLLDPTALLDGNDVANDEYSQFLADSFVNNPTIGFPSFVLGGAYQGQASQNIDYKLFAGSDSGLEENGSSYHNVFAVGGHRGDHRKGAFTAAELDYHDNGYTAQAGAWYDTGRTDRLGSAHGGEHGYGFYALAGIPLGEGQLAGRAGIANDDAQAAANFLSLAYQLPVQFSNRDTLVGVAISRTGDSDHLAFHSDPIYQVEAYWRVNVAGSLYFSPDVQYVNNAGFDSNRDGVLIGGARIGLEF